MNEDRPDDRVKELEQLVADAIPVVDELCAWVNTDYIGCVQVQDNGEELLKRLRAVIEGRG